MTADAPRRVGPWRILGIALPVVVSNATVPIQGAVDTAIVGNLGSAFALGGVGIAAEIFGIMIGALNFLQIGASGLTAQALGARDFGRVLNTLFRTLVIALVIGAILLLIQNLTLRVGLGIFAAGPETEAVTRDYFAIRIWGVPLELMNYAFLGWFVGQEMTRRLLQHQLVLTLSNIALSLLFAVRFEMGVEGVALATICANAISICYGAWLARARLRLIRPEGWRLDLPRILRGPELVRVMLLNRDLFIRSMLLMVSFAWFTRLGTLQGDVTLAANVVLWQFFLVTAYGLDGFAIAAETLVGQARGANDRLALRRAAIATSLWSGLLAVVFSMLLYASAGAIIDVITNVESVRETARDYALWAALIPMVGFAAFQLDGIFIGATESRLMRNAMILSVLLYLPGSWLLSEQFGNTGVWAGMWLFMLARAGALLAVYPVLERRSAEPMNPD